jgi:hypothetical protein
MKRLLTLAAAVLLAVLALALTGCGSGDSAALPMITEPQMGPAIYTIAVYPVSMEEIMASDQTRAKRPTRSGPDSGYIPQFNYTGERWEVEAWEYRMMIIPAAQIITRSGPGMMPEATFKVTKDSSTLRLSQANQSIGLWDAGDYAVTATFSADGQQQEVKTTIHVMSPQEMAEKPVFEPAIKAYAKGNQYNDWRSGAYALTIRNSGGLLVGDVDMVFISDVSVKSGFEAAITRNEGPLYDEIRTNVYQVTAENQIVPASSYIDRGWCEYGPIWEVKAEGEYLIIMNLIKDGKIIAIVPESMRVVRGLG